MNVCLPVFLIKLSSSKKGTLTYIFMCGDQYMHGMGHSGPLIIIKLNRREKNPSLGQKKITIAINKKNKPKCSGLNERKS